MTRTLLLVDDEENILRALVRLLRRDGYEIFTADSGEAALTLLAQHPDVGVVISDQRMPGMTGSEFLGRVKERFPETVRIMLSGYTELKSVTEAINQGAIYKFLTKPWDDELLRANVKEAFAQHDLRAENVRLSAEVRSANERLFVANAALERRVADQGRALDINQRVLELSREILEHLPVGVVGVGNDGLIAVANRCAHELLGAPHALVGREAAEALPQPVRAMLDRVEDGTRATSSVTYEGRSLTLRCIVLSAYPACEGKLLVLSEETGP